MYYFLLFYIYCILNYKRISICRILVYIGYLNLLTINKVSKVGRINYYILVSNFTNFNCRSIANSSNVYLDNVNRGIIRLVV